MRRIWRPQRGVALLILAFLVFTPLVAGILGIVCVTPFRAEHGCPVFALDPHDNLHRFVLLPALAGLMILGESLIVWIILKRWQVSPQADVARAGWIRDRVAYLQYGLLGLLWWLALIFYLLMDLAGSVSLHPGITAVYALCWILAGLLILHPRPVREKLLVVVLFAAVLLSIRSINWNSRKPFLKDLGCVRLGTPVAQVDELMDEYEKGLDALAQVDEQGRVVSGTITYRHTTEVWGNSDHGVLTIADGRVVAVKFLPD